MVNAWSVTRKELSQGTDSRGQPEGMGVVLMLVMICTSRALLGVLVPSDPLL